MQAKALASALAHEPIDHIASSNLARASMTADAVATRHPRARRTVDPSFAEMCFGGPRFMPPRRWTNLHPVMLSLSLSHMLSPSRSPSPTPPDGPSIPMPLCCAARSCRL